MEYGLQLNVGDKFLVNVDGSKNGGKLKHSYNGHWLRVEELRPPEEQYHRAKPARYLVEWYKEDNPGLELDPDKLPPSVFYWLDSDWATYIRKAPSAQKSITTTLPDI